MRKKSACQIFNYMVKWYRCENWMFRFYMKCIIEHRNFKEVTQMNEIIRNIEAAQLKESVPEFHVGDTVRALF